MAYISRGRRYFLGGYSSAFAHFCVDVIAFVYLVAVLFLGGYLISYEKWDPCWNVAISAPCANLGGGLGACIADFFFQTLGVWGTWATYGFWVWGFCCLLNRWRCGFPIIGALGVGLLFSCVEHWLSGGADSGAVVDVGLRLMSFGRSVSKPILWGSGMVSALLILGALGLTLIQAPWGYGFYLRIKSRWGLGKRRKPSRRRNAVIGNTARGAEDGYGYGDGGEDEDNPSHGRGHRRGGEHRSGDDYEPIALSHSDCVSGVAGISGVEQKACSVGYVRKKKAGDEGIFELPSLEFLDTATVGARGGRKDAAGYGDRKAIQENAERLGAVLSDFGIKGRIVNVHPGPVVTLYELEPAAGIKSSRIISLADDIARSMSAFSARVAVIPGKNVVGIELSNPHKEKVILSELLASDAYGTSGGNLPLALGKDISGYPVIGDLSKMPHLLVAGTTGSGKSVGINSMILSLLFRLPPDKCKFIMIDPKMLELSLYDDIPHLLTPVVTDPKKAILTLKWVVQEMENRYRRMSKLGVRNIEGYNQKVLRSGGRLNMGNAWKGSESDLDDDLAAGAGEEIFEHLPFIVVIVDEMADLMLVAGKELEVVVQRLAQMARAAGIHLIMATQRPSVDVITGTIKANFPTRISFQVTSKIDSRTILGEQGAEQLLGQGDMLYMAAGGRIVRVHGPYVSDEEIGRVVRFLKEQGAPEYIETTVLCEDIGLGLMGGAGDDTGDAGLYKRAVAIVTNDRKATTSYLQRQLQIGYNRAARLIEQMEREGVVSAPDHVGRREIL